MFSEFRESNYFETTKYNGGTLEKWPSIDLAVVHRSDKPRLIFTSINDAEIIGPKLRGLGFTLETFFWYLGLQREEVDDLLKHPEWSLTTIEDYNVFVNRITGNFMRRLGAGPANWFQKKAHFQAYIEFNNRIEAML